MIRSSALALLLSSLPATALAQQTADIVQSAFYATHMDERCQVLTLEGRIYAQHLISEVYGASDDKTEDMIRRMRKLSEGLSDQALEAGCTAAANSAQAVPIRNYFDSNALALSAVLDGLPDNCQGRAKPHLDRSRTARAARLYPAGTPDAQRQAFMAQIQSMADQWKDQCKTSSGFLNDDGSFDFSTSDWEKTPIYKLIRPYSEMSAAPEGATNYRSHFGAEGYRGLGPEAVAVTLKSRYIWNNGPEPVLIEGLGDGSLQVRLSDTGDKVDAVNLHRHFTTDGPGEVDLAFEKTGPDVYRLSADTLRPVLEKGGSYAIELKGPDGRNVFSANNDRRDARRDPDIYLSHFLKVRQWALAPKP